MKPILQKLPLDENTSFVCRTYRTPQFETPWHQHLEYELVMITQGHGNALIGDYFGEYQAGDVFFLGSNLPHWFRKAAPDMTGSALVVHFVPPFLGKPFLDLPEMRHVLKLFNRSQQGLKLTGEARRQVGNWLQAMESGDALTPLWLLLRCFDELARTDQVETLCSSAAVHATVADTDPIARVFEYTLTHFREPISLRDVAELVSMSRSTFCRRFKQSTKKSYVDFLKEVRIGHACKLLTETGGSVLDICYSSGYNNMANFSRQFRDLKHMTPLQYRKRVG